MDLRGVFFHNFRTAIRLIKLLFWNSYHSLKFIFHNISVGSNCKFHGNTHFIRKPGSVIKIGKKCVFRSSELSNYIGINRKCIIATHTNNATIIIGNNCGFSGTVIGAFKEIIIHDNVRCGANTLITDSDWHNDDVRSGEPVTVEIKANVWLGANVMVLKGVTIGENALIGAGSVVAKSIPPNVIAAGNPCKVIKEI